eukprot:5915972-Pyramimonas_sp.AAC.1
MIGSGRAKWAEVFPDKLCRASFARLVRHMSGRASRMLASSWGVGPAARKTGRDYRLHQRSQPHCDQRNH